jgi:hypothetical protein
MKFTRTKFVIAILTVVSLFEGAGMVWAASPHSFASRRAGYLKRKALRMKVVAYAQGKLGQQDGNGECWTLVDDALKAAGADTSGDASYVFGTAMNLSDLIPGDILQFEGVTFKHTNSDGSWYTSDYPHHTAIVESVNGKTITILNQNVNGDRHVQRSTINLDDKQGGTISAFAPKLK